VDDELDRIASSRLHQAGQRYTSSRSSLVALLADSDRPLTIPEILQALAGMPQSSVYRNLTVLEDAGLVQRVASSDEWARFELAEDITGHHHHLICTGCGLVRDVTLPPGLERKLDDSLAELAAGAGFTLRHHRLDLVGQCATCAH
jgi:Fur family ferric uptake transcriptional regulator